MKRVIPIISALLLTGLSTSLFANEKLILFGGGELPPAAIQRFLDWSATKGTNKYIVCAWASEDAPGALERFKTRFKVTAPETAELLPKPAKENLESILKTLNETTGVFFSGGDQSLIAKELDTYPSIKLLLQKRFHEGVVFAGTSAGTAIMAEAMVTGEGNFNIIAKDAVQTRPGLGLVRNIILDQHFIRRQRQNRILSLLQQNKERLGLGIDEDSAVSLEDNHLLEMLGPSYATVFSTKEDPTKLKLQLLKLGDHFDFGNQLN